MAILTIYMHAQKPCEVRISGTEAQLRTQTRIEYQQHMLTLASAFVDACANHDEPRTKHMLAAIHRMRHTDHISMAKHMLELWTVIDVKHGTKGRLCREAEGDERGAFLAAMLPHGDGYTRAYGLMVDLLNTTENYLTSANSAWVMGTQNENLAQAA